MIKEFPLKDPLLSRNQFEKMYQESFNDKDAFWSKIAKQHVSWSKDFTKVKNRNMEEELGLTPLGSAARKGHSAICHLLLESVVDVNVRDMYGQSALHFAAEQPLFGTSAADLPVLTRRAGDEAVRHVSAATRASRSVDLVPPELRNPPLLLILTTCVILRLLELP